MSKEGFDLDALIRAERSALDRPWPNAPKILERVEASMAAGVVPPVDLPPSAVGAQLGSVFGASSIFPFAIIGVLLTAGAIAVLTHAPEPPPPPVLPAPDEPAAVITTSTITLPPPPVAAATTAEAAPKAAKKRAEKPGKSDLREELELVRRAQLELKRGVPGLALNYLDEHARRFPKGAIVEERRALTAIALCRAGRSAEGKEAARKFLSAFPKSPHAGRVKAECLP